MKKNGYTYDALNNTLTITAAFAKKASKVGSLEYNTILKLRHDFPNLTIRQEEKAEGKKGLDYSQMQAFIDLHRNAEELTVLFERVQKLSKIQSMPYRYVKNWFEKTFPYYSAEPNYDEDGYVVPSAGEPELAVIEQDAASEAIEQKVA